MRTQSILAPLSLAILVFGCTTTPEPSGGSGGTAAGGASGSGGTATGGAGGTGGGVAGSGGSGGAVVSALCFSPTSGPSSLTGIAAVAATAEAVFVGHRDAIFQSANGKTGWTAKYDMPFNGHPVNALASHAGDVFVGLAWNYGKPAQPNIVYRAKADGSDWQPASTGLPVLGSQTGFGFATVDYLSESGGKLLAIVSNTAYLFDDATSSWTQLEPDSIGLGAVDTAEWDGSGVVGNSAQLIGGIRNDGTSWQQIPDLEFGAYRAFAFGGGNGFAVHQGLLDKTTGGGWSQVHDLADDISDLFLDGNTLYALGAKGVQVSTDQGATFTPGSIGTPPWNRTMGLAKLGSTVIAVGSETVHTTEDAGQSWQRSELVVSQVVELHEINGVVLAIVDPGELNTPRRTYRSADQGASWSEVPVQDASVVEAAVDGQNSYFVAASQPYVSKDGGVTLSPISRPSNVSYGPFHLMSAGGVLFASSSAWEGESPCGAGSQAPSHLENIGVARSTNGGLSWESMAGIPVIDTSCHGKKGYPTFHAVEQIGDTTFAFTNSGTFTSKDLGKNWSLLGKNIEQVAGDAGHWVGSTATGLVVSTNQGTTWSTLNALAGLTIEDLTFVDGVLYAATTDGIHASGDFGTTFEKLDATLTHPTHALVASNGQLFAGVGIQGVWRAAVCGGGTPP